SSLADRHVAFVGIRRCSHDDEDVAQVRIAQLDMPVMSDQLVQRDGVVVVVHEATVAATGGERKERTSTVFYSWADGDCWKDENTRSSPRTSKVCFSRTSAGCSVPRSRRSVGSC